MQIVQLLIVLVLLFTVLLAVSLWLNRFEPAVRQAPARAPVHEA